jgi:glycosyltransferase involved in cell wall biosynthesis
MLCCTEWEKSTQPNREIITNYKKQLKITEDIRVFGTISRLTPQKDLKTQLLRIFKKYLTVNELAKLVVIGEGPLLSELKSFSKDIGCKDNVIWFGKTSNIINEMLQIFDVFLLSELI